MSQRLFPGRRVLWMPLGLPWRPPSPAVRHCCADMGDALDHGCEMHADPFDCPDTVLVYNEPFGEYGLPIRDGGMSYLVISHCPWCGARLPDSARDRWFDAVEAAGLGDVDDGALPERFLSARWRTDGEG
jgi:hypothetical protein